MIKTGLQGVNRFSFHLKYCIVLLRLYKFTKAGFFARNYAEDKLSSEGEKSSSNYFSIFEINLCFANEGKIFDRLQYPTCFAT